MLPASSMDFQPTISAAATYIGMSTDAWTLILGAIQAAAVLFAIAFGLYELRQLRKQRAADSLEKMLDEWRVRMTSQVVVQKLMPLDAGSVELRAAHLALYATSMSPDTAEKHELDHILNSARDVVYGLNDLGAFVEKGSVAQRDFFGHFHARILELVFLLEPYVLLVSACRGTRWGLRLRRLRTAATLYHHRSRIHRSLTVRVRGEVVLAGKPRSPLPGWISELRLRRGLIPRKEQTYREEDAILASVNAAVENVVISQGRTWESIRAAVIYPGM